MCDDWERETAPDLLKKWMKTVWWCAILIVYDWEMMKLTDNVFLFCFISFGRRLQICILNLSRQLGQPQIGF
jgi:hypothetical protein